MHPRHGETERHHNWLLIKERDSAATPGAGDAVLNAKTSVLSGRTMDEITAGAEPKMTPAMTPRSEKQSARSGSENAAQVPTSGEENWRPRGGASLTHRAEASVAFRDAATEHDHSRIKKRRSSLAKPGSGRERPKGNLENPPRSH